MCGRIDDFADEVIEQDWIDIFTEVVVDFLGDWNWNRHISGAISGDSRPLDVI